MIERPPTKHAVLWCGLLKKFTWHEYLTSREVLPPPASGDAVEHIYRCMVSGHERRWGYDDPKMGAN